MGGVADETGELPGAGEDEWSWELGDFAVTAEEDAVGHGLLLDGAFGDDLCNERGRCRRRILRGDRFQQANSRGFIQ